MRLSGICAAVRCLELPGDVNVEILESSEGAGGVWQSNSFPGLVCDVVAYSYSYSFYRMSGERIKQNPSSPNYILLFSLEEKLFP
jgi:cation diffusion facilitator CzcD-associated flavoprotein CzcO